MSEERTFNLTLTGPQMDFVGKFTVDTLNAATTQAKVASELYQLLKAAVQQPARTQTVSHNGLQVVPEAEVDVSPRSPIP